MQIHLPRKYLNKFENDFSNYIKKKNVFAVSSAAAALEIIALLLNLKKVMSNNTSTLTVPLLYLLQEMG